MISLDEDSESPAAQVGPAKIGSIHDSGAIAELMAECEFITLENEFIRADSLQEACAKASFPVENVIPGIETLRTIQDKLLQRQAYHHCSVPSPHAVPAEQAHEIGFPCVLKARYGGYDGKGTRYVNSQAEYEELKPLWESGGWLAEELVTFTDEIAVMVVVDKNHGYHTFPAMITRQKNYVCDLVFPCDDEPVAWLAKKIAEEAVGAVNGIGLYGVELFLHVDGRILVNEIAPRPHNTGHYTLDWGGVSQFEAHVLSVLGGFSAVTEGITTCMANVLGQSGASEYDKALQELTTKHPEARMHWYGKKEAKPGRKMGHINVVGPFENIVEKAEKARDTFYQTWVSQS